MSTDPELATATRQLQAILASAKKANRRLRKQDITSASVDVPAPYAREKRLILGTLAHAANVQAIGTPRFGADEYRRGADVLLLGYASLIGEVTATYQARLDEALAAMAAASPRAGEDPATFRSSFLLGFRLGLRDGDMEQDAVEAAVATPDKEHGVYMRSTGSGAWAGYQAATGQAEQLAA